MTQTLGTSEEAVKKRVSRALERLRRLLAQRGIAVSGAALGAGLSQLPVTAAPATLASTVATLALRAGVPTVSISAAILKLLTASTSEKRPCADRIFCNTHEAEIPSSFAA